MSPFIPARKMTMFQIMEFSAQAMAVVALCEQTAKEMRASDVPMFSDHVATSLSLVYAVMEVIHEALDDRAATEAASE